MCYKHLMTSGELFTCRWCAVSNEPITKVDAKASVSDSISWYGRNIAVWPFGQVAWCYCKLLLLIVATLLAMRTERLIAMGLEVSFITAGKAAGSQMGIICIQQYGPTALEAFATLVPALYHH
jgi:predicted MFS family arabinose efflux permease